ncbi:MAG: DNA-3-methyladenine glycosylase 2 family protein [Candidatus Marinimicrobia bacterium]|nr:DNA-3-methyladenine glycosylase 2 family protein [Candidatus Neomarinimicrobiota bacterium]MBT7184912.1 DNA-3-methyladenine glycosylase 2 family protein [Candidatus Neomarinimicrobiota bacterium]
MIIRFMSVKNKNGFEVSEALQFLKNVDKEIIPLFEQLTLTKLSREYDYFHSLTRAIIYQQLSGKAAKTISDRFIALYHGKDYPSPKDVFDTEHEILRSVGLSNAKSHYVKNIAQAFMGCAIDAENIDNLEDEKIIQQLTSIKGVGPWTAEMFLIFTLNRPDVFPLGDLGVQKGFQQFFKLPDLPKPNEMEKRAEKWRPFRTIMSLYFWKVVDGPFEW